MTARLGDYWSELQAVNIQQAALSILLGSFGLWLADLSEDLLSSPSMVSLGEFTVSSRCHQLLAEHRNQKLLRYEPHDIVFVTLSVSVAGSYTLVCKQILVYW